MNMSMKHFFVFVDETFVLTIHTRQRRKLVLDWFDFLGFRFNLKYYDFLTPAESNSEPV